MNDPSAELIISDPVLRPYDRERIFARRKLGLRPVQPDLAPQTPSAVTGLETSKAVQGQPQGSSNVFAEPDPASGGPSSERTGSRPPPGLPSGPEFTSNRPSSGYSGSMYSGGRQSQSRMPSRPNTNLPPKPAPSHNDATQRPWLGEPQGYGAQQLGPSVAQHWSDTIQEEV